MKMERRMAVSDLEFREDSGGLTLAGYASTFNQPYDMGWYTERVDPAAFKRTLGRKPDVRLLINHDGLPLARTSSGTLTLDTDERGLRVSAELDPSDPDVARLAPKMQRGDLNQMSFAFRVVSDVWENDMSKRTLRELDLNDGDVSIVTYPANKNATAGLRSMQPHLEAVQSALAALEARAASPEEAVSVLTRALGYFTALDSIVDAAQEEIAEVLGIPNPDDGEAAEPVESPMSEEDDSARRAAIILELRKRRQALQG
jgi:HK97 family phage prohead protease